MPPPMIRRMRFSGNAVMTLEPCISASATAGQPLLKGLCHLSARKGRNCSFTRPWLMGALPAIISGWCIQAKRGIGRVQVSDLTEQIACSIFVLNHVMAERARFAWEIGWIGLLGLPLSH